MRKIKLTWVLVLLVSAMSAQEVAQPFSLQEAITYTLENNYQAQQVDNDALIAKKRIWETTAEGLPQINASVDYNNYLEQPVILFPDGEGGFTPITFGTKQNMSGAVTLNQLIFNGSYFVGLQYAETYLKIREDLIEKTEFELRETVTAAYSGVLFTQESIDILLRNIEALEKSLKETQAFVKAGFAEEQNAEQLEITLITLRNELNKTYRLEDISLKTLKYVMGLDIETEIVLTDKLEVLLESNVDFGLSQEPFDVTNHIDYRLAENDLTGSEQLVKLEKTKFIPSITAFANYQTQGNNDEFNFFNSDQTWFNSSIVGVSLQIPIFSSLSRSAKTAQAKIALENSKIALEETKQNLELNLRKTQNEYQFALDNYATAKLSLNLAERIESKETTKYFEGLSTSFNLTDAQTQLYSKQRDYLQSIYEIITSKAALDKALNQK